jgi:hypothetical protein
MEADALTGIRRAVVFLGLGVNAADNKSSLEYRLLNDSRIQLLPDVPDSVVEEWKSQFRIWIVGSAFRELVEHLCLLLDRIFYCTLKFAEPSSKVTFKEFERMGLDKKLTCLSKEFGNSTKLDSPLATFYPVRTCFVHRLGRVGSKDVTSGPLKLEWASIRLFISTPSGEIEFSLEARHAHQIELPEGGAIMAQPLALRSRSFVLGDSIDLTAHELTEILYFAQIWIAQILESATGFARSRGVMLDDGRSETDQGNNVASSQ